MFVGIRFQLVSGVVVSGKSSYDSWPQNSDDSSMCSLVNFMDRREFLEE